MASIRVNLHSGNYPAKTPANYTPSPIPPGPIPPGPTPIVPKTYTINVTGVVADSVEAVSYADDAEGKQPMTVRPDQVYWGDWEDAFFMPKPCMLKSDGTVAYYLNPNDYTKKVDGTASDVSNPDFDGNAMMEWGLLYYKFTVTNMTSWSFSVSNVKPDNTYKCWCNLDYEGNVTPHFYTAIYNSTGSTKMRSLSGVLLNTDNGCGDTTMTEERNRCTANNTTDAVEWYTSQYCDFMLIYALLIMLGKSINVSSIFGQGCRNNNTVLTSGALDGAGLFYGDPVATTKPCKIFGMENWYGYKWDRIAGLYEYDYKFWAKLTYSTADGTAITGYPKGVTSTYGLIQMSSNMPSNLYSYIITMTGNSFGLVPGPGFAPGENNPDTRTTYYASTCEYSNGNHVGMVGGTNDTSHYVTSKYYDCGISWHFGLIDDLGTDYISTRLTCKPVAHS